MGGVYRWGRESPRDLVSGVGCGWGKVGKGVSTAQGVSQKLWLFSFPQHRRRWSTSYVQKKKKKKKMIAQQCCDELYYGTSLAAA